VNKQLTTIGELPLSAREAYWKGIRQIVKPSKGEKMSIIKDIETCHKVFVQNPTRDNIIEWVNGITKYILNKEDKTKDGLLVYPDGLEDIKDDEWVSTSEFSYRYPRFCYPGSLSTYLRKDENFLDWCGKLHNGKFYVQHHKAIQYLSIYGKCRFRSRARKILDNSNL